MSAGPGRVARTAVCPAAVCDRHLGYAQLETTGLRDVFAAGIPERIPARLPGPSGRRAVAEGRSAQEFAGQRLAPPPLDAVG